MTNPCFLLRRAYLLLLCMNTLDIAYLPIWASSTKAAWPGRVTEGGWSSLLKLISISAPLKYSGMAGGAITARFTCRVLNFCSLFEGFPGWIMYIWPCGAGYCGSSTRGIAWMAPAMLLPAEGCVGGAGGGMIAGAPDGC